MTQRAFGITFLVTAAVYFGWSIYMLHVSQYFRQGFMAFFGIP